MLAVSNFIFESKLRRNLFFLVLALLIFLISKNFGMFDDDILFGSKMGNHLYNTSIFNWYMPDVFDPGHPPFLGTLLAFFWNLLGHHLWVTHLAILPFTVFFFIQLHQFISFFIKNKTQQFLAFLLILIDPTLSTCFVLVNIEIITLPFFFLVVNAILRLHKNWKFIGLFFLSIISFRSMMLFGGLFLFEILFRNFIQKENLKKIITLKFLLFYFLAGIPAFIYVIWRFLSKGWLQTHKDSPWEEMWHFADLNYFIRNCIVLVWRYLDFGRVFIMLFLLTGLFLFGKKIMKSTKIKTLLLLAISSVIFIILTILIVTNSVGIRYFIVSYICFNLLVFIILNHLFTHKKIIYTILFLGLLSGNFWIYPEPISTAWRATLGLMPYHSLRLKAIDYLDKNNISIEETASFFPNYTTLDLIDFSGDERSFSRFTGKEKYVFYSKVYNLSDKDINLLENNYTILKEFNNFNISIKIYILNTI